MSFIYVGRLDELKGVRTLFEAWKVMKDNAPELKVCGTGPLEDWCREFIDKHCLIMVSMLGNVPNTEVRRLVADSKALILPTQWYEGFPMTIVEAYSVGCPVVGSNIGNVGCLIEEGVTGWKVDVGDADKLAKKILNFSTCDRDEILKIYKEKYSDNQSLNRLEAIYSVLV